ncbi:MAG TPA: SDR family oxidoreductase [Melioribacteraceae bacterium]|nr:SDR family oxidoreductase [Melioribacteraceae bacterium]
MNLIFLLFGSTGHLGSHAVEYFSKQHYHKFYFISKDDSGPKNKNRIIAGDLSVEKNVRAVFSKIETSEENYYCLLNTVGGYTGGKSIEDTTMSELNRMLKLNLKTSFLISKYFFSLCRTGKGGAICLISALSGIYPEKRKGSYGISKNSINFLTGILALEGSPFNIRANAIAPYAIDSEENREWIKNKSLLVKPVEICKKAEFFFKSPNNETGEIIVMPDKLKRGFNKKE